MPAYFYIFINSVLVDWLYINNVSEEEVKKIIKEIKDKYSETEGVEIVATDRYVDDPVEFLKTQIHIHNYLKNKKKEDIYESGSRFRNSVQCLK